MRTQHEGDCTFGAKRHDGSPENGICICGYGLQQMRQGDWSQMYSTELRIKLMKESHPDLYLQMYQAIKARFPKMDDTGIDALFEREVERRFNELIENIFKKKGEKE